MEDRFGTFVSTMARISKDIQRIKDREMLRFGLRGSHVACLYQLGRGEQSLTIAELSQRSGLDKAAVSRTVAELTGLGFVVSSEQSDRRKYRAKLSLTEQGEELMERISAIIEESVEKAGAGLSDEERAIFYRALARISENIKNLAAQ